ncbi:MAG: hypothetical protein F6J98_24725 [Moorea sp. SIO4G2]|uniref:hypothetical protein n=1 Tax=Moorena TaxID=1155738 RepID=UPI001300FC45|nr:MULTISPECIES: hypothetical protein [Moorena]NEO11641.1 hypothetical protein [Moorena sp. SIO3E8]NEO63465.1 hypothetical protein [Moorena sp. SIO4G2]NEQ01210.1 hypothetical protein [Moorena sp. SIO3F7]
MGRWGDGENYPCQPCKAGVWRGCIKTESNFITDPKFPVPCSLPLQINFKQF